MIHNIVLYSVNISKEKLDSLIKLLLEKNKYDNDYYEFYKLKVIDRVLQKYISLKVKSSQNQLIEQIIDYVEENNLVSHLLSMYSKIYLSLSLYHSYEITLDSQEKSKEYYFIYQRLDNNNFLEKEFQQISNQILLNLGKNYLNSFNLKIRTTFLELQLKQVGKDLIDKYINRKDIQIENESLKEIENLLKKILEMNEPDEGWLNDEVESLIFKKIFYGLVKPRIVNSEDNLSVLEVGYDFIEIDLSYDYKLKLYYSSFYKTALENLLNQKDQFIKLVVDNILKSYLNSIPSFTDVTTKLPNINKLKNVLKELDSKEVKFFEIYLESVVEFSKSHNVKKSNEFFKAITDEIKTKFSPYRLFGPKVGFILDEKENYNEIIEFVENLNITFEDKNYDLLPIIGACKGKANTILDKSFYALSSAKLSKNKVFIYE